MSHSQSDTIETQKAKLELEKLALENKKVSLELRAAESTDFWEWVGRFSPLLASIVAVGGFLFGVWQYTAQEKATREAAVDQSRREEEARDRDFMKPLWDRELELYFRASEVVATIATTTDAAKRALAEQEFWKLYEGPLIIVEGMDLSGAMKRFGECLTGTMQCSNAELRDRSHKLGSVIQDTIQEAAALRLSEFSKNKFQYHR
jgi:hypothetical protein